MNLDNLITPPEERRNDPKAGNAEKLQSIGRTAKRIKGEQTAGNLDKPKREKPQRTNHAQKGKPKQGTTTPKAGRTENGNKGKPRPKGKTARTEQKPARLPTDESR